MPGFLDIHCHGGGGVSVAGADPDAIAQFARVHRRHGTTTVIAGLLSASLDSLAHDVPALAELVQEGIVAGIHLEGPYIAAEYRGMHEPGVLRDPEPEEVDRVLGWGKGTIRMATLAPEHPHGIDAVRRFADAGAIPAIGHTGATYERVKEAINAGASCMTHMFNAVRPVDHREPGPIVALSEDERVTCELILDGVHLHPAVAAFGSRAAEGRIVLITDAIAAADCGDGDYDIGNTRVNVRDGVARLHEGGPLAGSTLTMDRAVKHAVQVVGLPVEVAVAAATSTPARMLGLADRGRLAVGLRADLCHLSSELDLLGVWAQGRPGRSLSLAWRADAPRKPASSTKPRCPPPRVAGASLSSVPTDVPRRRSEQRSPAPSRRP